MITSTTDLDRFRQAFYRDRPQLLETSHLSRYRPPDPATAELSLLDDDTASAAVLAEILDLSGDGMKIAIGPGAGVRVGQLCLLKLQQETGDNFELRGQVRWVETSTYILVFGILLLTANTR